MAIFRGQGFLFYFLLAAPHPFIAHSIRCGATLMLLPAGGIPARFPACLLLPIAAGTDACRMLCAKPAVELPVMALHAGLFGPPLAPFAASMSSGCGWPADFMPALRGEYACLRLADTSFRSPSLRVLLFTTAFGRSHNHFPPQR